MATTKLVKLFIIFGPVHGNIKVIKKYANPGQTIDESLMSTLCLPRIELLHEPGAPKFQTFLVTKEDGHVLYGSGLIVYDRHNEPPPYPGAGRFASYCYTIITDTPFINATRSLLQLIWDKGCDDIIVRSVMNIPLPARRRCLRIVPPLINNQTSYSANLVKSYSPTSQLQQQQLHYSNQTTKGSQYNFNNNNKHRTTIDDIYLYRGMTDLPLLDYPLRELFSFLQIDDFLLAFACILMEFRTLIISQDNYKLMMVGETLTSLLLPLKWCNVYVPILPPVYGATYLDAPTSYIMGINTQVTELPDNLQHVQCRIYCDESRVVCDAESLALPLFLNEIKTDIIKIIGEYQALGATTKPFFTYLDDLKFNRAIRVLFIKTIRKNILQNYERYIVDVPESSSDIRQFDVVSYLSDQPDFMHSFLSKFLDTQLFASFIDENAKRIQQSWLSIFDMDPDELSEHFTDKALEESFQKAHRIHLMDLRDEHPDIEVKTVPASPMKLRRRLPVAAASLANRLSYAFRSSSNSSSMDHGSGTSSSPPITSSPPIHRNSVATVSLQGHLSLQDPGSPVNVRSGNGNTTTTNSSGSGTINITNSPTSLMPGPALNQQIPNGKIVELINEVKHLTKDILVERMEELAEVQKESVEKSGMCVNNVPGYKHGNGPINALVGSLCDLIERVWSHGAFATPSGQDNTACCPLWNHLIAFTRLKYIDSKPSRQEFADGSHLNVLLPAQKSETTELDMMVQNTTLLSTFNWFKSNRSHHKFGQMARDLINDLVVIQMLKDVKTDVGKARAFIKLSLEKKKLSTNLKTLLGDRSLLDSLYKPYAFLRCEDEREKFLVYLETLEVVDLPCFTTTFVSVINTRKMKA